MVSKKLIVIGASSGIGREIVCKYAEKDWRVGITGRRKIFLDEIREKYPEQIVVSSFDYLFNSLLVHVKSNLSRLLSGNQLTPLPSVIVSQFHSRLK